MFHVKHCDSNNGQCMFHVKQFYFNFILDCYMDVSRKTFFILVYIDVSRETFFILDYIDVSRETFFIL